MTRSNDPRHELMALVTSLKARIHLDMELKRVISYMALKESTLWPWSMRQPIRLMSIRHPSGYPAGTWRLSPLSLMPEKNPYCFSGKAILMPALLSSEKRREPMKICQGRPFVGKAGQLLTKIIQAMGLTRQDVYICNILKCRPPGTENPKPDEITTCEPFLVKTASGHSAESHLRPGYFCRAHPS